MLEMQRGIQVLIKSVVFVTILQHSLDSVKEEKDRIVFYVTIFQGHNEDAIIAIYIFKMEENSV